MKPIFLEQELPIDSLKQMGLWKDGKADLRQEDLQALLSGRRTDLITLRNVHADGFVIEKMDLKLSLQRSESGTVSLGAHPIYHQVQQEPRLTEKEMLRLTGQDVSSLSKQVQGKSGEKELRVFEYDAQTKEFLSYQPVQVQAPEEINGMPLSKKQKTLFQLGEPVEFPDGTIVQHRASEPKGMLSDRAALVISVLLDGGISYLLLRGISSLLRQNQKDHKTDAFQQAFEKLQRQQQQQDIQPELERRREERNTRGMSR